MASPNTLRQNNQRGFTFIELLIGVAILAVIFSLSLFIGFDFYKSYSFHFEKNTIVSVLQKARSQSLNNINQAPHGVYFANPLQYIIFECVTPPSPCTSYAHADTSKNIVINPAYGISITGTPFDVIFDQLSGASSDRTITVTDSVREYDISINSVGRIDWE